MQRIIDCCESGEIADAKVSLVVADRECYGMERAEKHGIKNILIKRGKTFSAELEQQIPHDTDLIVLAGFLSILSKDFTEKYAGKIINIHPALLPKFGGKGMWGHHVHEAVIASGETESGATVHYVTAGVDEGGIILQKAFSIVSGDSAESLAAKVHQIEYEIFPKAISMVLNHEAN